MEQPAIYTEYPPATCLEPFIDCYWILRADNLPGKPYTRRIIPDICDDIILNLGEDVQVFNGQNYCLGNEKAYFIGSMTTFQDTLLQPGTHLMGIRFKPFGVTSLLGFSLQGTANCIEELNQRDFSLDGRPISHALFKGKLDTFLAEKIKGKYNREENSLIETVLWLNGQITVEQLADRFHISERQLERKFEAQVGLTIKEVCNLIRFHYAFQLIKNRGKRSLLDIAFEAGYYDHAHLTRHFKRYVGYLPSQVS